MNSMRYNPLLVPVLGIAVLVCGFLGIFPASAASGTVTVTCNSALSETGGDDMSVLRAMFRSASRPFSHGVPQPQGGQIGLTHMRVINCESGSYYDYGQGRFIAGSSLIDNLDKVRTEGMKLHIVVGQIKPQNLPGTPWNWTDAQWSQYEDYCFTFARYVLTEYSSGSFSEAIFEIGNEWDISDEPAWVLGYVPNMFDTIRYDAYLKIYQRWQQAIYNQRFITSKPVKIWGGNFNWPWHDAFIQRCANSNWLLDGYTFHAYGNSLTVGNGAFVNDKLTNILGTIRRKLSSVGRGSTPVLITEWGPSWQVDSPTLGKPNYNHIGAAWTAAFLRDALKGGAAGGSYLVMSDQPAWGFNATWCSFVYRYNFDTPFAKPPCNVMRMCKMMTGTRKRVTSNTSGQPNIGAIASTDSTSFCVLVYNYNTDKDILVDNTTAETVTVRLINMPFTSGSVRVRRYLVDANTSNLARKLDAGQAPDSSVELQEVQNFTGSVSNRTFTHSNVSLAQSAVSLWVITKL